MRVTLIAAVAENGTIGRGGALPWHLSADLRRFKRLTLGHHLVVGRKTFEAIGRPLAGRKMVVVTRRRTYRPDGVEVAGSLEEALERAAAAGEDEVFIAGGGEIYRQSLPLAQRLHLTRVHARIPGDTRFPPLDETAWEMVEREDHAADEKNPYPYSFLVYERRK